MSYTYLPSWHTKDGKICLSTAHSTVQGGDGSGVRLLYLCSKHHGFCCQGHLQVKSLLISYNLNSYQSRFDQIHLQLVPNLLGVTLSVCLATCCLQLCEGECIITLNSRWVLYTLAQHFNKIFIHYFLSTISNHIALHLSWSVLLELWAHCDLC